MELKEILDEERKEVMRLYKSHEERVDALIVRKHKILQLEETIKDLKAEVRHNKHWPLAVSAITIGISFMAFLHSVLT